MKYIFTLVVVFTFSFSVWATKSSSEILFAAIQNHFAGLGGSDFRQWVSQKADSIDPQKVDGHIGPVDEEDWKRAREVFFSSPSYLGAAIEKWKKVNRYFRADELRGLFLVARPFFSATKWNSQLRFIFRDFVLTEPDKEIQMRLFEEWLKTADDSNAFWVLEVLQIICQGDEKQKAYSFLSNVSNSAYLVGAEKFYLEWLLTSYQNYRGGKKSGLEYLVSKPIRSYFERTPVRQFWFNEPEHFHRDFAKKGESLNYFLELYFAARIAVYEQKKWKDPGNVYSAVWNVSSLGTESSQRKVREYLEYLALLPNLTKTQKNSLAGIGLSEFLPADIKAQAWPILVRHLIKEKSDLKNVDFISAQSRLIRKSLQALLLVLKAAPHCGVYLAMHFTPEAQAFISRRLLE